MKSPIITLTTDFGKKDHYVGALKGSIFQELEQVNVIDISHEVSPFHIEEAAFIIQNAYNSFPKGSIHIIGIDSELTPENKHIALLLDDHYFICADNGLISLITQNIAPKKIVEINIHNRVITDFPVLDVFVKVACHLARGGALEVIGKPISVIKELTGLRPIIKNNNQQITGSVIYIDNYGNVITNITQSLFEKVSKGRRFMVQARGTKFAQIFECYSQAIDFNEPIQSREEDGKKLALWNSSGYLELAIYRSNPKTVGSASSLFGLHFRDTVTIEFEN